MTDNHVSICIPAYNGERYLRETLNSALAQTYTQTEILLVDDGSADNTLAIAQQYAASHPQLRVVQNKTGGGMVANWMRCVEEARYRWIKFLFQDDTMTSDCVEKMLSAATQTGKRVVLCARDFLIDETASEQNKNYFQTITKPEQLFPDTVVLPHQLAHAVTRFETENILGEPVCLLFDKTVMHDIGGFDTQLLQLVDFDFALRAGLCEGLAFVREPLVHFRVHEKQQSVANSPTAKDAAAIQKAVRTDVGDALLLLQLFWKDNRYGVMKEVWTEKGLLLYARYIYLRACKRFGQKAVNKALAGILPAWPQLYALRYNYLTYKMAKYRYRQFKKEREKHNNS